MIFGWGGAKDRGGDKGEPQDAAFDWVTKRHARSVDRIRTATNPPPDDPIAALFRKMEMNLDMTRGEDDLARS